MKKIIVILIVTVMLIFGGYCLMQKQAIQPTEQTISADPACNGEKNEYYSLGFGVEHRYKGEITKGQPVHVVLSCDHTKMTITGAVNQQITGSEELADLSVGSEVIAVSEDYNFDGLNDLSALINNGQGSSAVDTYDIYLYDPTSHTFVRNGELSELPNLYPDSDKKEIVQEFGMGPGQESVVTRYKWTNGKLVKVK